MYCSTFLLVKSYVVQVGIDNVVPVSETGLEPAMGPTPERDVDIKLWLPGLAIIGTLVYAVYVVSGSKLHPEGTAVADDNSLLP